MTQLNPKIILKAKGDEAYISVKQLMVTLEWSASVDLDLMAFYKTKDGQVGSVFSENYAGGSMGRLNTFPFIQLSGDAGVGSRGGPNEEVLRITKLDHIQELYICAINFADASQNRNATFSQYDGHVIVNDEKGKSISVPLDSNQPGTVAVIARIDNTGFMGAKLINENRLMDMPTFQATIPGASLLKLSSKVFLKQKGDTVKLKPKGSGGLGEIVVNLNWNQQQGQAQRKGLIGRMLTGGGTDGIDLDLGCLFQLATGQKGVVQALGNAFGSYGQSPYVMLSGDDRTGAWAQGEDLRINGEHVGQIRRVLVYAFIYEGIRKWSQADAVVTIKQPGAPDVVIELDEHRDGKIMCAIALFDNIGNTFSVQRVVQYFNGHSDMDRSFGWGLRWVRGTKD